MATDRFGPSRERSALRMEHDDEGLTMKAMKETMTQLSKNRSAKGDVGEFTKHTRANSDAIINIRTR